MADRWLLLPSPFLGPAAYGPLADVLAAHSDAARVADLPPSPFTPPDVLASFAAQAADFAVTALVPHSNAGLYAPSIWATTPTVAATIYVDAALPAPDATQTPLAPPAFADHVAVMAGDDGLLPPWTRWWDAAELGPLFPSPEWFTRVDRNAPAVPAAYVRSFLPVPAGWTVEPNAYLAFGETYAAELSTARDLGWPADVMDGQHLHLLTDPDGVAARIRALRERCATQGAAQLPKRRLRSP
ncbi:MAG: hypothetical protein ABI131_13050 [Nostocoides sp.]